MAQKAFWLSYDLGLKGDYPGLYAWLDGLGAQECGDSVAYVKGDFADDLVAWLKREVKKHVKLSDQARMYVVYVKPDTAKPSGTFLFGKRKRSPWEGYAQGIHGITEDQ